ESQIPAAPTPAPGRPGCAALGTSLPCQCHILHRANGRTESRELFQQVPWGSAGNLVRLSRPCYQIQVSRQRNRRGPHVRWFAIQVLEAVQESALVVPRSERESFLG